jgi:hypothetical protein
LVGVGFALLSLTLTITGLQAAAGAPVIASALKRTVTAAGMLVFYPKILSTAILGLNILTGSMVTSHLVSDGVDKMLGAAFIVAAVTGGLSLGLAVGAACVCLYFFAGLMVMKIGLTSIEAVLLLAGALVWGLYPLPGAAWLARAWTAGAATVALIPIAWALIFSAGALMSSDSLVWATGSQGGLPNDLQQIVKPFTAVAFFWLAFKAPNFMLMAARAVGLHPAMIRPGSGGAGTGGGSRPGLPGGGMPSGRGLAGSVVQTNADRFRAIGSRLGGRIGPATASATNRTAALRGSAVTSIRGRLQPLLSPAASRLRTTTPDGSARVATGAKRAATFGAKAAKGVASAPIRANRSWRELAAEGARLRAAAETQGKPLGADRAPASRAPQNSPDPATRPDRRRSEDPRQGTQDSTRAVQDTSPPASPPSTGAFTQAETRAPRTAAGPTSPVPGVGESGEPAHGGSPNSADALRPPPPAPSALPAPRAASAGQPARPASSPARPDKPDIPTPPAAPPSAPDRRPPS